MTAQYGEELHVDGEWTSMATEPLAEYFALGGRNPGFSVTITTLWRGYVGRWSIDGGRLYLIDIQGKLEDGSQASLKSVFPGFADRVFAHWYNGTVRIPRGKLLHNYYSGYDSIFECDEMIRFDGGVVVKRWMKINSVPDRVKAGLDIHGKER
jgi:hypothetical protein